MKHIGNNISALVSAVVLAAACVADAGTDVSSNITTSVTWTKADSPYHLKKQIYVEPGATLTIEAGVVVASFVDDQGSLAVCRGAKIYVNGTKDEPVIMTSAEDVELGRKRGNAKRHRRHRGLHYRSRRSQDGRLA